MTSSILRHYPDGQCMLKQLLQNINKIACFSLRHQWRQRYMTSRFASSMTSTLYYAINYVNAIWRHSLRHFTCLSFVMFCHFAFSWKKKNEISESFCKKNNFTKLSESKALKMKCFSLIVPLWRHNYKHVISFFLVIFLHFVLYTVQ